MDERLIAYLEELWKHADERTVPSGVVHWSYVDPYGIAAFDGGEWCSVADQRTYQQLQLEIQNGAVAPGLRSAYDAVPNAATPYHDRGITPIGISHYVYQTPRRAFIGHVMNVARREEPFPPIESLAADAVLDTRRAFYASAILQTCSDAFELLPYRHRGLEVHFAIPRELFLTNVEDAPEGIEIDFDDGTGVRRVAFDEVVTVAYEDELPKHVRLSLSAGGRVLRASFRFVVRAPMAPSHEEWPLIAVDSYGGSLATGWAWVFKATGHAKIEQPIIFADGWGAGSSDVDTLWGQLNGCSLASNLLAAGKDIIMLGYKNKVDYVQANALLAVACIRKVIQERKGNAPLVVGGGSMGGVVTRYALLWMENRKEDHQTAKYLSYDAPHEGAWLPIIVQYFTYRLAQASDPAKQIAALLQTPATRQLLWAWVQGFMYAPAYDSDPLRVQLRKEMAGFDNFPKKPKRYGVANGANGVGNGINAGANALTWYYCLNNAGLKTQPPYSDERQYIGSIGGVAIGKGVLYYTKGVQALDGAPGGTRDWFGSTRDALKGFGDTTLLSGPICFVWSSSALAAGQGNVYTAFNKSNTPFDDVMWGGNSPHATVTQALADWILARFS